MKKNISLIAVLFLMLSVFIQNVVAANLENENSNQETTTIIETEGEEVVAQDER